MKPLTQQMITDSAMQVSDPSEANLRKQLAYLYRIFDHYGWCDLIVTHLSVRIPGEDALLILPFGLAFKEITPDNLLKVDFDGNILDSPYGFGINNNGTTVHRSIYRARPDLHCLLHTHSQYGVTVSNLEEDLMLLDQIAMMFHNRVGYHDFDKLFIADDQQTTLLKDLADNDCLILKNHGLLTASSSIIDAFWFHYYLETTCKLHVLAMSTGGTIKFPSAAIVEQTAACYSNWREKNHGIDVGDAGLLFEAAKRAVGSIFDQ